MEIGNEAGPSEGMGIPTTVLQTVVFRPYPAIFVGKTALARMILRVRLAPSMARLMKTLK
jgi:hypothetical protein